MVLICSAIVLIAVCCESVHELVQTRSLCHCYLGREWGKPRLYADRCRGFLILHRWLSSQNLLQFLLDTQTEVLFPILGQDRGISPTFVGIIFVRGF